MTKAAPNLRALDSTGRTSLGAGEKAELALTLRETARGTEWVFTSRPENAPPLAEMSAPLRALAQTAAFADPDRYWWWITDAALAEMAARLRATGLCIVDGILGGAACGELRREVLAAHAGGHLRPSKLAGGRTGKNLSYSLDAVRGDVVGWFDGYEDGLWAEGALPKYLTRADTLISELGKHMPELSGVSGRSKAMVAQYAPGTRYVRHCDNSCHAGEGERCNGRRLTAIVYLNPGWSHLDGGELRVYEPFAPKGRPPMLDPAPDHEVKALVE